MTMSFCCAFWVRCCLKGDEKFGKVRVIIDDLVTISRAWKSLTKCRGKMSSTFAFQSEKFVMSWLSSYGMSWDFTIEPTKKRFEAL